jgi:hypothetical protein
VKFYDGPEIEDSLGTKDEGSLVYLLLSETCTLTHLTDWTTTMFWGFTKNGS